MLDIFLSTLDANKLTIGLPNLASVWLKTSSANSHLVSLLFILEPSSAGFSIDATYSKNI